MSKQSRKFRVPDELANLYDFANSLDLRCFTHHGRQHEPGDELNSPANLGAWMSERGLSKSATVTPSQLDTAIRLRSGLRAYLECAPLERRKNTDVLRSLNKTIRMFPLVAEASAGGAIRLQPAHNDALAGLALIVAELQGGAASGALDRLKVCASEECRRVFFDR